MEAKYSHGHLPKNFITVQSFEGLDEQIPEHVVSLVGVMLHGLVTLAAVLEGELEPGDALPNERLKTEIPAALTEVVRQAVKYHNSAVAHEAGGDDG